MLILPKSDLKSKVSRKDKVYPLNVKDKKRDDQTYDQLHKLKRIS